MAIKVPNFTSKATKVFKTGINKGVRGGKNYGDDLTKNLSKGGMNYGDDLTKNLSKGGMKYGDDLAKNLSKAKNSLKNASKKITAKQVAYGGLGAIFGGTFLAKLGDNKGDIGKTAKDTTKEVTGDVAGAVGAVGKEVVGGVASGVGDATGFTEMWNTKVKPYLDYVFYFIIVVIVLLVFKVFRTLLN